MYVCAQQLRQRQKILAYCAGVDLMFCGRKLIA